MISSKINGLAGTSYFSAFMRLWVHGKILEFLLLHCSLRLIFLAAFMRLRGAAPQSDGGSSGNRRLVPDAATTGSISYRVFESPVFRHLSLGQSSLFEIPVSKIPSIRGLLGAKLLTAAIAAWAILVSLWPIFSKAPDCSRKVRSRQPIEIMWIYVGNGTNFAQSHWLARGPLIQPFYDPEPTMA